MNRRDLIKAFAALAPMTVAGRVWAAPATDARLLVVFLRGAYDAANVVVPVSSDFYYASRPTLALPGPMSAIPMRRCQLERGLGPASGAARQHLSIVGASERSHSSRLPALDDLTPQPFRNPGHDRTWPAVGGSRDYRSGFMSRLAAELTRVKPIAFTDQLPLMFRGEAQIPNIGLKASASPASTIARPD